MDMSPPRGDPPFVVVGIDPEPSLDHEPVRWAAHEAGLRGAAPHWVHARESAPAHHAHYAPMRALPDQAVRRGGSANHRTRQNRPHTTPAPTAPPSDDRSRDGPCRSCPTRHARPPVGPGRSNAPRGPTPAGAVIRECPRCAGCPVVAVGTAFLGEWRHPTSFAHTTGVMP